MSAAPLEPSGGPGGRPPAPDRAPPPGRGAGKAPWRHREIGLAAALVAAALAVRYPFLPHESNDFTHAYSVWYDFIAANEYFRSWQYDFAFYNPPYLYLLTAAAYFFPSAPALFAAKGISFLGDFLLALFSYRCVRLRYPGARTLPLLAAGAAALAPTVVLNSARWSQVDALYTAFLLACLLGLLRGRPARAAAAFGLAFAFKAQAVFLAPLFYWLRAKKAVGAPSFWPVPAVLLAALVPAWAAGGSPAALLSVFVRQAGTYSELTSKAPNLYQWISNDHYRWWPAGVLLTLALVHGVRRLLESRRFEMTRERVVFLALLSALLTPFFLPKMLDRFFFPADVLSIVLAFYRPRLWYVPVAVGAASLTAYANSSFHWWEAPLGWAAALLLAVLFDLTRRLLRDLGVPLRLGAGWRWLERRAPTRRAAAAPLLALLLGFAALFAVFAAEGRLDRPLANDGASAKTLARAVGRSSDDSPVSLRSDTHGPPPGLGLFRGYRPAADAEGRVTYGGAPGGSFAFDSLLAVGLRHFGDDPGAGVTAARASMLALFCAAALLAYLSFVRVLALSSPQPRDSSRWMALGAVFLAFGGGAAAGADAVTVEGAPQAFGTFLLFHGITVFLDEARFRQLLAKSGAALLLGLPAWTLLAPFVALGLLGERRRRRRAAGEPGSDGGAGGAGVGRFLSPFPAVALRGSPIASPYLALGAFGLAVSVAVAAAAVGAAAGAPGGGGTGTPWGAAAEGLRRVGAGLLPAGAFGGGLSAGEGAGTASALVAALLAALGIAGGVAARSFPLLALALSGLGAALGFGAGAPPEAAALLTAAVPLAGFASGLLLLSRRWRRPAVAVAAAGAAVILTAGSWAVFPGGARAPEREAREASEKSGASRTATARLREDFGRIRRVLRRRAERTVFLAPLPVGGGTLAGARAEYLLGEAIPITDPARRSAAEFVVAAGPEPDRGDPGRSPADPSGDSSDDPSGERPGNPSALLTPGNEVVFLYHRAAYDGELDGLIEAAGAPAARSEFDVHLGGGRLLFVKDDCRPEHLEGTFIAHLFPEDPDDLPPRRKPHGFENRSFRFADRAWERGERCVAGVRFPAYPVRSVVVGRSFRNPDASYDAVWRAEFAPPAPGAGDGGAP